MCPYRSFSLCFALDVFEKFIAKIHGDEEFFWQKNFGQIFGQNGSKMVRFSGRIGQIWSDFLLISTLDRD